ncbi:hypothetical protein V8D89_014886 [Ganoderma adspersum]
MQFFVSTFRAIGVVFALLIAVSTVSALPQTVGVVTRDEAATLSYNENTMLKRHGAENTMLKRQENTMLKRHGEENTMLKRHGQENTMLKRQENTML